MGKNLDEKTNCELFENYQNHSSIIKIKESVKKIPIFDFLEATKEEINKITKFFNPNKAIGPDRIPLKIIKTASNVFDTLLAYVINEELQKNKF